MLKKLFRLAFLPWVAGCFSSSNSEVVEVRWRMQAPHPAHEARGRTLTASDMNCFFASISGQSLQTPYASGDLGAVDVGCLGLGEITPLVNLSQATTNGVSLKIPIGNARKIRILGVKSLSGNQCQGLNLKDYWEQNADTQLYELGSTTVDLFRSTTVTVANTFDAAAEKIDLLDTCGEGATGNFKEFLYVANSGASTLTPFEIDPATGALSPIGSSVALGTMPGKPAITAKADYLFVPLTLTDQIARFSINSTTGALTFLGSTATLVSPTVAVVSANGKFLYVSGDDGPAGFTIGSNGSLNPIGSESAYSGEVFGITTESTGKFLIIGNKTNESILVYSINALTGTLTLSSSISLPLGETPSLLEVWGSFLYVNFPSQSSVRVYSINSLTGALANISGSPFSTTSSDYFGIPRDGVALFQFAPSSSFVAFPIDAAGGLGTGASTTVTTSAGAPCFDRESKYAYLPGGNDIYAFSLGSGGAMTALTPASYTSGSGARWCVTKRRPLQ